MFTVGQLVFLAWVFLVGTFTLALSLAVLRP